jgi:diguanylate cyclase (GGDEF)-like protein
MSSPANPPESLPGTRSWLCRDDFDRRRMIDMEARVRPVRRRAAVIMSFAILAAGPWLGWWPLVFVVCILSCFAFADRLMDGLARPEFLMFAAWVASGLTIAAAVALSGPLGAPALSWMAIPVMTLSTRFSIRGVLVGVALSIVMILTVAFTIDRHVVLANPVFAIVPVALVVCVAVLSTPLMQSDIKHRSDAVLDQLTGMLNRTALEARVQELAQQADLTGEPVGVIVGDLDRFKSVNDTHGHAAGDAVLKDVAYVLRKQLRAFDLAYRLGGEEFLVLLPGGDLDAAAELAERLRAAVEESEPGGGLHVTMSLGASASARGEAFDYEAVFADADAALYDAKHAGSNCVRVPAHRRVPVLAV